MDWKNGNDYLEEEEEILSGYLGKVGHKMGFELSLIKDNMWWRNFKCLLMCMRYQSAQKEFDFIHGRFVYGERLNVHVRMSSNEFDIIHGRFGYGIRNGESFGYYELMVVSIWFENKDKCLMNFSKWSNATRRRDRSHCLDCKVIPRSF